MQLKKKKKFQSLGLKVELYSLSIFWIKKEEVLSGALHAQDNAFTHPTLPFQREKYRSGGFVFNRTVRLFAFIYAPDLSKATKLRKTESILIEKGFVLFAFPVGGTFFDKGQGSFFIILSTNNPLKRLVACPPEVAIIINHCLRGYVAACLNGKRGVSHNS